jgi:rSAM/selenodomain-associated transferase 2
MTLQISIVIPVLNEAKQLAFKLQAMQSYRNSCQLLLIDGGSHDASESIAKPWVDKIRRCPPGRARQMNFGAALADAEILLFLHADTQLPDDAVTLISQAIADGYQWGRFDVMFDNPKPIFKLIAMMMNLRSRLTGIATGDQCLFVTRRAFQSVGGFPEIALMEDIAMSARLKKLGKPCCLAAKVITSARRWEQHGVFKIILLMWRMRLAYFFGADPNDLARRYYRKP